LTTFSTQLAMYLKRSGITELVSCRTDIDSLRKCICSGLFGNAVKAKPDGTYMTVFGSKQLHVNPNSVLKESPEWMVFYEVLETDKAYMSNLTTIEPEWLAELAPHYYILH